MEIDNAAFATGAEAANTDIAARRARYQWSRHAGHRGHWIVNELEKRFDVGVNNRFGICFVTASQESFDHGYNITLAAEINRRHGHGAFEAVFTESRRQSEAALGHARRAWLARHPDEAII